MIGIRSGVAFPIPTQVRITATSAMAGATEIATRRFSPQRFGVEHPGTVASRPGRPAAADQQASGRRLLECQPAARVVDQVLDQRLHRFGDADLDRFARHRHRQAEHPTEGRHGVAGGHHHGRSPGIEPRSVATQVADRRRGSARHGDAGADLGAVLDRATGERRSGDQRVRLALDRTELATDRPARRPTAPARATPRDRSAGWRCPRRSPSRSCARCRRTARDGRRPAGRRASRPPDRRRVRRTGRPTCAATTAGTATPATSFAPSVAPRSRNGSCCSWPCRLPALRPDASEFRSHRSSSSTRAPARLA